MLMLPLCKLLGITVAHITRREVHTWQKTHAPGKYVFAYHFSLLFEFDLRTIDTTLVRCFVHPLLVSFVDTVPAQLSPRVVVRPKNFVLDFFFALKQ